MFMPKRRDFLFLIKGAKRLVVEVEESYNESIFLGKAHKQEGRIEKALSFLFRNERPTEWKWSCEAGQANSSFRNKKAYSPYESIHFMSWTGSAPCWRKNERDYVCYSKPFRSPSFPFNSCSEVLFLLLSPSILLDSSYPSFILLALWIGFLVVNGQTNFWPSGLFSKEKVWP